MGRSAPRSPTDKEEILPCSREHDNASAKVAAPRYLCPNRLCSTVSGCNARADAVLGAWARPAAIGCNTPGPRRTRL
jgi:hypothetical protein